MSGEGFEIRLMRRVDQSYYFELKVRSEVKPLVKALGILEAKEADAVKVAALAGALAEHLCEKYSDKLNPEFVARQAYTAYIELMSDTPSAILGDIAPRVN